ncbi:type VI secretion system-associated FHA domain protein [Hydrogenimonas sp.]
MTGVTQKDPLLQEREKSAKKMDIDGFLNSFAPDESKSGVFDALDASSFEDDGILSLLGGRTEHSMEIEHALLPDLNEIIDVPLDETPAPAEPLGEFARLSVDEEPESDESPAVLSPETAAESPSGEEGLIKIFAVTLGVDIEKMDARQKEAFVIEAAMMISLLFEQLGKTVQGIRKIKKEMGILPRMDEVGKNPLLNSKSTKELFENGSGEHLALSKYAKELFQEIDRHHMAFYGAFKQSQLDMAQKFAPENLLHTFKKEKKLNGLFKSEKSLAWEAYAEKFEYLNVMDEKSVDMKNLQKEYRKISETLKVGYSK